MGLFSCCFSTGQTAPSASAVCENSSGQLQTRKHEVNHVGTTIALLQPCKKDSSEDVLKKSQERGVFGSISRSHAGSGLECALALQAVFCTAGHVEHFPEARAALVVHAVLRHLGASAVRLYVIGSLPEVVGVDEGLDGPLVQITAASSAGEDAEVEHAGALGESRYLSPMHEPVGTSSMLLRRALVEKVSIVHKVSPSASELATAEMDTPAAPAAPTTTPSGAMSNPDEAIFGRGAPAAVAAAVAAAAAAAASGSSAYSASCAQPDQERCTGGPASRFGTDVDLCDADAVPGSAMLFAALPLSYGLSPIGVLWVALPYQAVSRDAPPPSASKQQRQQQMDPEGRPAAAAADDTSQVIPTAAALAAEDLAGAQPSGPVALLCSPAALQQLAMSAAMALAAGTADPPTHFRRLATSMNRLAGAASLAELVGDLCAALVAQVQERFLVDAVGHAALVPSPDSRVAFMLRPEHVEGAALAAAAIAAGAGSTQNSGPNGIGGGGSGAGGWGPGRMTQLQAQTLSRLRMSSTTLSPSANLVGLPAERSRSVTMTMNLPNPPSAATAKRQKSNLADLSRAYATVCCPEAGANSPCIRPWSLTNMRMSVPRDVFMLDGTAPRSDPAFGLLSPGGAAGPPPTLSARAFRLSNTLLQAMLQGAAAAASTAARSPSPRSPKNTVEAIATGPIPPAGPPVSGPSALRSRPQTGTGMGAPAGWPEAGVLPGVCVCDCARHVQDERQPNRDVCMLMLATAPESARTGAGTAGGAHGPGHCYSHGFGGLRGMSAVAEPAGGPPGIGSAGGGSGGAQSLVLLGMEAGDGAVLAVYLALPTPAPPQLLEGVRDSSRVLLAKILAGLVRQRLRSPDLAAEWETLRAGIPGSYLSVSRATAETQHGFAAAATNCTAAHGGTTTPPLSPVRAANLRSATFCRDPDDAGLLIALQTATSSVAMPAVGAADVQPTGTGGKGSAVSSGPLPAGTAAAGDCEGGVSAGGRGVGAGSYTRRRSLGGPALMTQVSRKSRQVSMTSQGFALEATGPARGRRAATPTALPISSQLAGRTVSGRAMQLVTRLAGRITVEKERERDSAAVRGGGGGAAAAADGARSSGDSGPLLAADEMEDVGGWPAADGAAVAPGAAATAMLTVHDLDETYESWGMRAHMGALVESIMSTTLRSSGAHCRPDEGGQGDAVPGRSTEGLEELQLSAVLGQGASGVVLRGTLGCAPVAVKIMEMPDADSLSQCSKDPGESEAQMADSGQETATAAAGCAADGKHQRHQQQQGDSVGGQADPAGQHAESREVRARRALLRNAMEVAIMRSISHVNIVQAFGVYDNVIMERHEGRQGVISLRRVNHPTPELKAPDAAQQPGLPKSSPICTAIVMQLCDRGSLADVLHSRTFPALPLPPPHPSASPAATAGVAMQYARYWKGVYMTLLEIALALRHLHSRRLVHRDLKPGNILLKSSPGDPRGWTCKLADFGFALVLDRVDQQSQEDVPTAGAPSTCNAQSLAVPSPGPHGGRDWYTVQQHLGGTVTHMAPEAFRKGARIDASVDVFSFGIIMWELVSSRGHRPYRDMELDAISGAVTGGARPFFAPGDNVPVTYRQLAKSCWAQEPRARPTAAELVSVVKGLLESVKA